MRFAHELDTHTLRSLRSATAEGIAAVKRENEHLRFITDELSHRIKNLVAII